MMTSSGESSKLFQRDDKKTKHHTIISTVTLISMARDTHVESFYVQATVSQSIQSNYCMSYYKLA